VAGVSVQIAINCN